MKTLLFFESAAQSVPQSTAWYLADLGSILVSRNFMHGRRAEAEGAERTCHHRERGVFQQD